MTTILEDEEITTEDPTDPDDTDEGADGELGGKPNKGTNKDGRLKRNKPKPAAAGAGTELAAASADTPPDWRGVLLVEGTPTGDGREFAPESVTWPDPS